MATGDGWTNRLLEGLAEHLAGHGIGVWRPAGVYGPAETAIVVRGIPQSPDRLITLSEYVLDRIAPGRAEVDVGIQIRVRGTQDPRIASDIGDAIYDLLESATNLSWNGIPIALVERRSYAPLGDDTNSRLALSHNYVAMAIRATSNRT